MTLGSSLLMTLTNETISASQPPMLKHRSWRADRLRLKLWRKCLVLAIDNNHSAKSCNT